MIWLIGNKGMLGQEIARQLNDKKIPFVSSDREVSILEPSALSAFYLAQKGITTIINCSAYTAVDKAETEVKAAYAINRDGVGNVARLAAEKDILLIHISTDYVFNGTSSLPQMEEWATDPVSIYGASKLAGEEEIKSVCTRYFIIRTAWLYGLYGPNFVYTMLKLMNKLEEIKVVEDQVGSPTNAEDLAGLILSLIETKSDKYGLYHFSGEDRTNWFEFSKEIYRLGRENKLIESECIIHPCSSDQYPSAAKRPAFSLLSKDKVKTQLDYHVRSWQEALEDFFINHKSEFKWNK